MRKLRIALIGSIAVAFAEPAHADGWYVGLGLAPAWLKTEFNYADGSQVSPDIDTSFMMALAGGFKWQEWRFEVEPFWTVSNTNRVTVVGPLGVNPLIAMNSPNEVQTDGDIRTRGFLFNVAYDMPIDNEFGFTLGGGIGWANMSPSLSTLNHAVIADHGETSFAWQIFAGFTYALSRNFEFQLDYRYTGIGDTGHHSDFTAINPVSAKQTNLQAVMVSVRWYLSPTL